MGCGGSKSEKVVVNQTQNQTTADKGKGNLNNLNEFESQKEG